MKTTRRPRQRIQTSATGLQRYQVEAGSIRLLTPTEEVELSAACQTGLAAERRLDGHDWEADDERRRLEEAAEKGLAARNRMIEANLRFVMSIAFRYDVPAGFERADIIQAGNAGLVRAVEKYDPSTGYRFTTYAEHWIRHEIQRAFVNEVDTIRIPHDAHIEASKIARTVSETGDETPEGISEKTGLTVDKVKTLQKAMQPVASIEAHVGCDDGDATLGSLIADPDGQSGYAAVDKDMADNYLARLLDKAFKECLTKQERDILIRRASDNPPSLRELGEELGVSRERIRQIERTAKQKIRRSPYAAELRILAA